jgi:hypothetical protein
MAVHKIDRMAVKFTNFFHCRTTLHKFTQIDNFGLKSYYLATLIWILAQLFFSRSERKVREYFRFVFFSQIFGERSLTKNRDIEKSFRKRFQTFFWNNMNPERLADVEI